MSDSVTPSGSCFALGVLLTLVVLSPWPFGGVHPVASWLITLVCLLTAAGVAISRVARHEGLEVPLPAALAASVFLVGLLQLVPIPPGLHELVAPGSAAIWHPSLPEVARVLGEGARPISIWPEATFRASVFGLGVTALTTFALPALRDRRRLLRSATVVVASGVAVAVYGLAARLLLGDKLYGFLDVPTIAPFGPFVSKNHFSGYVEMAALLGLGLAAGLAEETRRTPGLLGWVEGRRAPRVILAIGAVVVLVLSVLVSLSRGGAFALTVGVATSVLLRTLQRRRTTARWSTRLVVAASALAVALSVLLVLPPEARERLRSITAGSQDSSTAYRALVWQDSLLLGTRSPLVGHGLGTFVDALPPFKTGAGDMRIEHAENDYLELLAETGVAGLLLALGAALALAARAQASTEANVGPLQRSVALGAVSGLAALAAHSLVDFNLRIPSNALLFALLAASSLAVRRSAAVSRVSAGILAGLGAALLLLTHVASSPSPKRIGEVLSGRRLHAGAEPATLRVQAATSEIERHLGRRPADAEAWVWLGWALMTRGQTREGSTIAAYGSSLDPHHAALRAAADRLNR